MADIAPTPVNFDEAIRYFRQKVNLPTQTWDELWQGMHARAFTVAGATKDGMLTDFRAAIDDAIANGTTISDFRKSFDGIVSRYGWDYVGGRDWRSRVIFDTNLRMAHAAGRWDQIQRTKDARPFLRYIHTDGEHFPRPQHVAWAGTTLPADDPWWSTHYPPNGWGCKCYVVQLSQRDLDRNGWDVTGAPPTNMVSWTNPRTGAETMIPEGIDPGWGYNVGEAASGTRLADEVMDAWRAEGANAYEPLTSGDWQSLGLPAEIPPEAPPAPLGPPVSSVAQATRAVKAAIGADEASLLTPVGRVTVDASALASHMDINRAPLIPVIPGALADPKEVWLSFERHKGTGQVFLRQRFVRSVSVAGNRNLVVVAQANKGRLEAWTVVSTADDAYINRQRRGRLIFAR